MHPKFFNCLQMFFVPEIVSTVFLSGSLIEMRVHAYQKSYYNKATCEANLM